MSQHDESTSRTENPAGGSGSKSGGGCGGGTGSGESIGSLHAPVSSEGGGEGTAGEAVVIVDQIAESFDGEPKGGELESLPGFDPQRALGEGMPTEILTDELLELCEKKKGVREKERGQVLLFASL